MTDKVFHVRTATEADIDRILEIERASFPDPWVREAFTANLGAGYIFSVICNNEDIIGFAILSLISPEAELYNIAVVSEYRGSGAAQTLFNSVIFDAKAQNIEAVFLEVRESNLRARGFYKKEGFSELGIRKNYYKHPTENAVLMAKNL